MASMSDDDGDAAVQSSGNIQGKPLDEMDREELVAYIGIIQPSEDMDALKYLEYEPLLEMAVSYKTKLDGLKTTNPNTIKLPALPVNEVLTMKQARQINSEYRQSVKRKNQQQLRKFGNTDNSNNINNSNNGNNTDISNDSNNTNSNNLPLTGSKRSFKDFAEDARVDMLVNMSKSIDISDEKAVRNFERISKALYSGGKKKKRRRGDTLVYNKYVVYIYPRFFIPFLSIFVCEWFIY